MPRWTKAEIEQQGKQRSTSIGQGAVKRNVIIPMEVYERLVRIAREEERSVNQQMVAFLRDSVEQHEAGATA